MNRRLQLRNRVFHTTTAIAIAVDSSLLPSSPSPSTIVHQNYHQYALFSNQNRSVRILSWPTTGDAW
jgi:hypothetical protein